MTFTICHSGKSSPSARAVAAALSSHYGIDPNLTRTLGPGVVNWGRRRAVTELNPRIDRAVNKRVMRLMFVRHGVPAPRLYSHYEAVTALNEGTKVLGRPDFHSRRQGFWLVDNDEDLIGSMFRDGSTKAATHFMEWVDKDRAPREYRAHVFKGRSIRISEKAFDDTGGYTTARPEHCVDHVRSAAKQAVSSLDLDFGAVDVLANDEECWVLEVNTAPGLGGSMLKVYARAFVNHIEGEW